MKLDPADYTKNNYTSPLIPVQKLLMGMGWRYYQAAIASHDYSAFEIEQAIKAAQVQSAKQGKNLVKVGYIMAILRNTNNPQ